MRSSAGLATLAAFDGIRVRNQSIGDSTEGRTQNVDCLATEQRPTRPDAELIDRCRRTEDGGHGGDHRFGGWGVKKPTGEQNQTSGVAESSTEFAHELGLKDDSVTAELFAASGGNLVLGRAAAGAAASAVANEADPSEVSALRDVSSTVFADYVASLVSDFDLGLTSSDAYQAAILSHLSIFTRQTALMVVSVVGPRVNGEFGLGLRDPEGVLMRLRMEGTLVPVHTEDERRLYRIPSLIAGHLRLAMAKSPGSSTLISALVVALADHLENSQVVEAHILDDVLTLSRRFEQWQQLARIQESVGLPMFLIAPHAACAAFGHLPVQVLSEVPALGFLGAMTDDVLDRLANGSSGEDIRTVVMQETKAGRMRAFFPGPNDRGRGNLPQRPSPYAEHSSTDSQPNAAHPESGEASEPVGTSPVDSGRADFISTLGRMISLTREDRHEEAVSIGLAWSSRKHGRWAQLTVRLLTAISLFHRSQFRRSVSILGEIESDVVSGHVDGDFLLPAVTAWTALASVVSGDHERADRALSGLDEELRSSLLVEELVRPAAHVASALRALDRLDLELAEQELDSLSAYPENRSLWAYLPAIGRTIAILTASTESSLLFVNDDVEKYQDPSAMSATGRDLLAASKSMVFIGLGQLKRAEVELERMSQTSDARIALKVRVELVAGRLENVISMVDTWFYHSSLTPVRRAELAVIKAAALLRIGRQNEAVAEFVTAIDLSTWVSSLLPVAMLPQADRNRLLDLTSSHEVWDDAYARFSGHFRSSEELLLRLRTVGSIAVGSATIPQLSSGEAQLLELLSQGLSISQISTELHQVTGTVKNRLSALYRKFDVSGRSEVITRARAMGFLTQ